MRLLLAFALTLSRSFAATVESHVKDLIAKYTAARENRDMSTIGALFTEDADQLVSQGIWRRGRPALQEGMLQSSMGNPGSRTIPVETVRSVATGVPIADALYIVAASPYRP